MNPYMTPAANDERTLEAIGREPGIKRRSTSVVKASTDRLIRAGLVMPPTTNGRLYLTEAGVEAYWQPAPRVTVLDGRHGNGVEHACSGCWHLAGRNAAGHEVFACDAGRHLYVAQHRSADHRCLTGLDCASVVVAS